MHLQAPPFHLKPILHELTMASKVIEATQNSALKALRDTKQW